MSRTRDTIEFLRHENKELKEELNELKKQVETNSFILKYGESGVKVDTVYTAPLHRDLRVKYLENDQVVTVIGTVKKYIFDYFERGTSKVEILKNNLKFLIFNLKFNDMGIFYNYPFMINKETKTLSEYPFVDLNEDQRDE